MGSEMCIRDRLYFRYEYVSTSKYLIEVKILSQMLGAVFQSFLAPLPQARPGGEPCTRHYVRVVLSVNGKVEVWRKCVR